jgi:preprotein translocase SecE subunit
LGSLAVVFAGIPALWSSLVDPMFGSSWAVSGALRIVVMVAVALGLFVLGGRLLGPTPVRGLKAGVFFGMVLAVVAVLITFAIGHAIEPAFIDNPTAGIAITAAVGIVLGGLGMALFFRPQFERFLIEVEEQGWFSAASYKRMQGQRVRRWTMVGIIGLAGCGIYTLHHHNTLITGPQNWQVHVPFSADRFLVLLPDLWITLPLVLAAASLWLAYRVVNLPVFADFLIATEAELNKVSWTTRRRLVQDTIVVLTTVVLLTCFLFVVDQAWAFMLTRVGVLQLAPGGSEGELLNRQIADREKERDRLQASKEQDAPQKVAELNREIAALRSQADALRNGQREVPW